jgi:mono/diheme cytochrome c family protein
MFTRRFVVLSAIVSVSAAAAEPAVTYNEHIRPILSANCFACHGIDAQHREAKLRLDTFEGATAEREGVRALVPGDVEKSELWQRIISPHEDEVMPPPDSHKPPLKPEQRELIRRWIQQGAVYQKHWAYEPVAAVPMPPAAGGAAEHPVDRFIGEKLAAQKLSLSEEASRETLIRRLTLDLTGLPPTVDEVEAFRNDHASGAYERLVERLLASPRYGEHFGRYWLDAVRYADTHGLHLDNVRTIWPYRDWVVQAFNRNLPFDQFTIEQLAGDLLPNPSTDQLVASGYNRHQLTTAEGGAIEAEAEMRNTADRVDTTAAVFMGMTANCASCHDHKFDPLTQREYYQMGAIFKGLADRVWDGNVRLPGPIVTLAEDPKLQARIHQVTREVTPLERALTARVEALIAAGKSVPKPAKTPVTYEVVFAEDSDLVAVSDFRGPPAAGVWREGEGVPVAGGKRALRLEGGLERKFNFTADDVKLTVPTEVRAFVHFQPDPARPPRAVSLEFVSKEKTKRMIWGDRQAFGPEVAATALYGGPLPATGTFTRLELTACDSGVAEGKVYSGVRVAQSDGAGWWDRAGVVIKSPSEADDPLLTSAAWSRPLRTAARDIADLPIRHDIKFLLGLSGNQQNDEEKARLERYHRDYINVRFRPEVEEELHAVRRLMSEQTYHEVTYPSTLISRELAEPLPAHILVRGQYDKPGDKVEAGTPAFLPPIAQTGARVSRLDFARWLVDPKHPLTARVTVNRFWQQLFGAGLVRTPGDFGVQGEMPTHPALLDWLAREFVRSGWDVKAFVRLLVTSRTYRQDSVVTPALLERDPENRLLARGPRLRLDAEVLRDQALAIGGLLNPRIGGPPVRPYQPANIWEPVAFGGSNTKTYVQDKGDALYRRSLYTFWKRTAPAPAMSTFDAPARENFCVGRPRSNTPLQALALMNDVQQFEASRAFAERLLLRTSGERERLVYAFQCVTARAPDAAELKLLGDTLATHRTHYTQHTEAASQVIANGESKPSAAIPVVEFAAWTMVANLLLNLDETIVRN